MDTTLSLFLEAGRAIKRAASRRRAPLSLTQFEAMRFARECTEPSMRDLAAHLCVTAPSATALVDELARAGYLRRAADKRDRRQVRLLVTEKGSRAFDLTLTRRKAALKQVLSGLSTRDHRDLQRVLVKIIN